MILINLLNNLRRKLEVNSKHFLGNAGQTAISSQCFPAGCDRIQQLVMNNYFSLRFSLGTLAVTFYSFSISKVFLTSPKLIADR
ncbi:MAG: hypothetical protein F6K17_09615 [Okeania sp. SIO3C4]|nr:hypothetical protein [Okeania sp. SIO3B3]NER02859.1 hypothetical protein [Okeania sp. SIO3C4]